MKISSDKCNNYAYIVGLTQKEFFANTMFNNFISNSEGTGMSNIMKIDKILNILFSNTFICRFTYTYMKINLIQIRTNIIVLNMIIL